MLYPISILSLTLLALIHLTKAHSHEQKHLHKAASPTISFETRAYWMRRAIAALSDLESPCHWAAFGTVIVNHTDTSADEKGKLICIGVNGNARFGNPTLHGMFGHPDLHLYCEIAAINNCSTILSDAEGDYKLSPAETLEAFMTLSLYTTAEACPMCASAIRWSGFKEYIYATSIETLSEKGWDQIAISSKELFEKSEKLPKKTAWISDVLANETDDLFAWQFDESAPCPNGCARDGSKCVPAEKVIDREL